MSSHQRVRRMTLRPSWTGSYYRNFLNGSIIQGEDTQWGITTRTSLDTVGNYPNPNGFESSYISITPQVILNGERWVVSGGVRTLFKRYLNYPESISSTVVSSYPLPSSTEQNNAVVKAMSSTNPSNAVISVPTFVGELKDVPGLVRTWGRRLINWAAAKRGSFKKRLLSERLLLAPKGVGEGYVTWKWVIAPTVSDITTMLRLVESVNGRFNRLKALRDKGMVSGIGPSQLDSTVATRQNYSIASRLGEIVYARRDVFQSRRIWASCQWRTTSTGPNASNLPSSDKELMALSWNLVRGITSFEALQTAWELLPWSWFIDWFSNVGASVKALNNTVHANPGNYCVMCERTTNVKLTPTSWPSWVVPDCSGHEEVGVWKWRKVFSTPVPFTLAGLPVLTGHQWSILASLKAMEMGREKGAH